MKLIIHILEKKGLANQINLNMLISKLLDMKKWEIGGQFTLV